MPQDSKARPAPPRSNHRTRREEHDSRRHPAGIRSKLDPQGGHAEHAAVEEPDCDDCGPDDKQASLGPPAHSQASAALCHEEASAPRRD